MSRCSAFAAGGCCFAEDPDRDANKALPLWDPDCCPYVLRLVALGTQRPLEPLALLPTDPRPSRRILSGDGTSHILYGQGDRSLQICLSLTSGRGPPRLIAELPARASDASAWVNALQCFSQILATGRIDSPLPSDKRGNRWLIIIRALDGSLQGMSQREIATILVGAERVESDWRHPGQHLRDRVRRAVKRGHELMNGGYLKLLR